MAGSGDEEDEEDEGDEEDSAAVADPRSSEGFWPQPVRTRVLRAIAVIQPMAE
ncbi:hypothetical protein ACH4LE_25935 [Streptomyces sp. NPDC017413]|uniref:hypothetical protein n=1 Tax=Streptomyces sp. NPDC017413 TaxID=3364994 RepID=UPI0037B91B29